MTFSPASLGLPKKFSRFRSYPGFDQWETAKEIAGLFLQSDNLRKRFVFLHAPPGSGKTVLCRAVRELISGAAKPFRDLTLTVTRNLQDQLQEDFPSLALVRGRSNYQCSEFHGTCDLPAKLEQHCGKERPLVGFAPSCPYRIAVDRGFRSGSVNSNYSLWLSLFRYGDPLALGKFDFLVCDEAHNLLTLLTDFASLVIDRHEIAELLPDAARSIPEYQEVLTDLYVGWALENRIYCANMLDECDSGAVKRKARLKEIYRSISVLASLADSESALANFKIDNREFDPSFSRTKISPVWPGKMAEEYLFRSIPRVLLCSGSLTPDTPSTLGLSESDYHWIEVSSAFPARNRPFVYLNMTPQLKMAHNLGQGERSVLVNRVDQIIRIWCVENRYKTLILTSSYEWNDLISSRTQHKNLLITHDRGKGQIALHQFKQSDLAFLCTPTAWEGIDLASEEYGCIILLKIPFMDSRSPIIQARKKSNSQWANNQIANRILQGAMRMARSENKKSVVFILDWHWTHFSKEAYFPMYFRTSFRKMDHVPAPQQLGFLKGDLRK